jgi:hypothetical protein
MPIPQCLTCGNLSAISRLPLPFFLRVSGLWLRTHNSMETISVIPPRRIPVAIGLRFYCNRRHLPVQKRSSNRIPCPISVQEPCPSSHSGTEPPQVSRNRTSSATTPMLPSSVGVPTYSLPRSFGLFRFVSREGVLLNLAEPELLLSVAGHADVLSLISHRERAILGDGLQ